MEDEVPRDVNFDSMSGRSDQHTKGVANSVPAAAVIRRPLALFGFTGLKAGVGGAVSTLVKSPGLTRELLGILSLLR